MPRSVQPHEPCSKKVFVSRSSSNCKDDIAILVLESPVEVVQVPLRSSETSYVGEAVSMLTPDGAGGLNCV
jgi:hypothetical protein